MSYQFLPGDVGLVSVTGAHVIKAAADHPLGPDAWVLPDATVGLVAPEAVVSVVPLAPSSDADMAALTQAHQAASRIHAAPMRRIVEAVTALLPRRKPTEPARLGTVAVDAAGDCWVYDGTAWVCGDRHATWDELDIVDIPHEGWFPPNPVDPGPVEEPPVDPGPPPVVEEPADQVEPVPEPVTEERARA